MTTLSMLQEIKGTAGRSSIKTERGGKPFAISLLKTAAASIMLWTACPAAHALMPVGEWKAHLSYDSVSCVTIAETKAFGVANGHLMSVSLEDGVVDTYSKTDGLASNEVQKAIYDASTGRLLIAYADGNADFMDSSGDIFNLPYFATNDNYPDKTVNDIALADGMAYLSCNFGIVKVNMRKMEFADAYIPGYGGSKRPAYGTALLGGEIYVLTDSVSSGGTLRIVKHAPATGVNLSDYNNWKTMAALPPSTARGLEAWSDRLITAADNDGCYYYDGSAWVSFAACGGTIDLGVSEGHLLVSNRSRVYDFASLTEAAAETEAPAFAAVKKDGALWIGTASGMTKISSGGSESYSANGPATSLGQFSYCINGSIYVCPGLVHWTRPRYPAVVQQYSGGEWNNIYASTSGAFDIAPGNYSYNFTSVAIDPEDERRMFVSSWDEGIFEYYDGRAVKLHNYESSGGVLQYCKCLGSEEESKGHCINANCLLFDDDGLLWVHNSLQAAPLKYMTRDGVWHQAASKMDCSSSYRVWQLLFSSNGLKWMVDNSSGLYVLNDNGTYDDSSDDDMLLLKNFTDQYGNSLSTNTIYQIAEDRSGDIWLATDIGPIILKNSSRIFRSDYACNRVLIARNDGSGLADYLLDGVDCRAIVIDGADRKWIGTANSGVFLVSADGQQQLGHFTTDNSPMTSNVINSMAYNGETGEIMVVTQEGMASYMTDSSEPAAQFPKGGPIVFPNPVRPDYTGYITIRGLEEDSNVRITDSSGNLIFEGTSEGGTLSWDGKNYRGSYVGTGIYYVHCSNSSEDNNRSTAAKFMVIR